MTFSEFNLMAKMYLVKPNSEALFRKFIFVSVFAFAAGSGFAQSGKVMKALKIDAPWFHGTILMNDNSELTGLLRYNAKIGVLSFEEGEDMRTLSPRTVQAFQLFDGTVQKQRIFYSFDYLDPKSRIQGRQFFELLMEFDSFSVLSKVDPLEREVKTRYTAGSAMNGGAPTGGAYTSYESLVQLETVYLMDANGKISPYVETVTTKTYKWKEKSKDKSKVLDHDLLEDFMGKKLHSEVMQYAKKNELDVSQKQDLIKILEYYKGLSKPTGSGVKP